MNFKDRFESMVSDIEKLIEFDEEDGYLKPLEIVDILCQKEGKLRRDLGTIFEYISGMTLINYIKNRKMMATYIKMLKDEKFNMQSYIEASGYGRDSSFSSHFSQKFGMTPTDAFKKKDKTLIEKPISIDDIISSAEIYDNTERKQERTSGISKDTIEGYNEISKDDNNLNDEICEFQSIFGLEDIYVELVVHLNEKKNMSLKDAFEVVDNFVTDYEDDISSIGSLDGLVSYIDKKVPAVYVKHLYPDVCLPELNDWYFNMKYEGGNSLEEDPEFVRAFIDNVSDGLSYKEMKDLYLDYQKNYKSKYDKLEKEKEDILAKYRAKLENAIAQQDKAKQRRMEERIARISKQGIFKQGFKEYLEIIQEYGSLEAYNEFMDYVCNDYKKNGISDYNQSKEDDFWAEYDERHFENM